jgi:two-component system, response regulator
MNPNEIVDILLVEDNPRDAELTIRALKKNNLAGQLFLTEDGAEALDFIYCEGKYKDRSYSRQPKIVLLDLKLPKVNGLEVLKTLKSKEETRRIPVVILTSSQEDPDVRSAYDLGANSYVVKPVLFEKFIESLTHIGQYWMLVNQSPI